MKILKVKKHWLGGETDVSLEAPEFENFGNRLEEMQRLADEANPTDPAEVEASTAKMMAHVQELQEQARKRHEAMPTGPKKAMDSMMLGMLEQMAQTAAHAQEESEQPDDDADEGEVEESEEEKRNPHLLDLTLRGIKWNKDSEKMLEKFFADWPQLRSLVLRGVFEYYKGIYPELVELYDYHKGRQFFIPEPTSPEAIQDIFYFHSITLDKDGSMGLCGFCTWDEEHGFGVRLQDGKVTQVGAADIAY
jgi:hypothetical protein